MRRIPFRALLPFAFSLASIGLMAWGLYAEWRCVGYDAGKPFWPCETPDFFLNLLSAPPVILAQHLANFWGTAPSYFPYALELPLIFGWWWFVGTRLDFGLLGVGAYRRRLTWLGVFIALFVLLLVLFGWGQWEDIRFYQSYPDLYANPYLASLGNLRSLPPRLWLLVLIFAFGLAALRVARGRTGQTDKKLVSTRTLRLFGLGFVLYCIGASGMLWHSKLVEWQKQADYDLHRIIIQGRVLDDRGLPVYAIEVDLVPVPENRETPHWLANSGFTNEEGEYTLSPEQAGRYMLSVQWNAPPSTRNPFLTRYYPDTIDPKQAETLEITPARHLTMNPIRLERLGLVKVPVSITWSNGQPEPDAYLLLINTLYPDSGVIGSESLHPDTDGTVSAPVGFEYRATAQVECDAGQTIQSAYTPEQIFSLKSANAQTTPLHFVLPGNPCRVWHPR